MERLPLTQKRYNRNLQYCSINFTNHS